MTTDVSDEDIIQQVTGRLVEKNPTVAHPEIEALVREEFAGLAGRPVHDYLSVLTERAVKKRIKKGAAG
jgi:hypothetical protein